MQHAQAGINLFVTPQFGGIVAWRGKQGVNHIVRWLCQESLIAKYYTYVRTTCLACNARLCRLCCLAKSRTRSRSRPSRCTLSTSARLRARRILQRRLQSAIDCICCSCRAWYMFIQQINISIRTEKSSGESPTASTIVDKCNTVYH
jgi:hypothetical protein